ncbi:hypothetical protein [Phaeobacter sp. 22II1-1F12B]|uniref:hypothetical protein n=1 Tax=Phaeobacter sp. 22II1-1F12B TaxID=1317111 RepID=UPI000B522545|nr:hypothetical protein [Phaeobacter sp. 22II1-1F12B]OWU82680.1 hypothetical protein ATO1_01920 [Phaeobacter sp. 22II1-1F12B]
MKPDNANVKDLMRLDCVLEEQKDALMRGEIQDLNQICLQKPIENFLQIGIEDLKAFSVETIRRKLERNERLYDSAIKGIESAKSRLNDLSKAQQKFSTYTRDGKSKKVTIMRLDSFERKF